MNAVLIRTEGKTDWKHLKAAFQALHHSVTLQNLHIEFYEDDVEGGYSELMAVCRTASQTPPRQPLICIFDNDLPERDASKVIAQGKNYKKWGNNVFSIVIPIPPHRQNTKSISIEHYYTDKDLMREDNNGKRLYLGSEFSEKTGALYSDLNINCKRINDIQNNVIIDSGVLRLSDEKDVALRKNQFADYILEGQSGFQTPDFSAFMLIFNIITEIIHNELSGQYKSPPAVILTKFNWREYIESLKQDAYTELDPVKPDYYVPLEITQGTNRNLAEETILNDLLGKKARNFLIYGRAGSGKTYQLERICVHFADQLLAQINTSSDTTLDPKTNNYVPDGKAYIPLLIRLNLFDCNHEAIEQKIIHEKLKEYGMNSTLEEFIQSGPQFIFLIDDLDEVTSHNYDKNLEHLRQFMLKIGRYPRTKIVLAGRQAATQRFRHQFRSYEICDLSRQTVAALLGQLQRQPDLWRNRQTSPDELINWLEQRDGLFKFLSTPYLIRETARYWNDPGPKQINASRLLFTVFDSLINRQEKTEYRNLLNTRVTKLEELAFDCLSTAGEVSKQQQTKYGEESIGWFQHMGFISYSVSSPKFSNQWIHAYLVAHYLTRRDIFPDYNESIRALFENVRDESLGKLCKRLLDDLVHQ